MHTRLLTTCALLCLTAVVPPAVAQDAGFAERLDVELVNVDVWVSDAQGHPVTGLTAADFEVLHDGRAMPVTYFTEMRGSVPQGESSGAAEGGEAPSGATAAGGAAPSPSHVVVYFDQTRLHPSNYPALLRGLEDFLAAEGVEPERVLVLRQTEGLFVEAPFGSSAKDLKNALERISKTSASGLDLEAETQLAVQAIRDTWEQLQDMAGSASSGLAAVPDSTGPPGSGGGTAGGSPRAVVGGFGSGSGPDACGPFANQVQPILDSFTRSRGQRIVLTLSNLSDTISFLAGLRGVKALLYLSDGLDIQPGAALASYASGLCPASSADLLTSALSEQLSASFNRLTRHANSNRVTVYSLQASGLRSPGDSHAKSDRQARGGAGSRGRSSFDAGQRMNERQGLSLMADETGGLAVFNRNDFGPDLARIGRDLGTYYSLAFEPPAEADKGPEHKIEVRLGDRSLSARYRRGYLDKDDDLWMTERIEGALNLGITDNPLQVRLGAGDLTTGEGTFRLPLHVMVPVERLAFLPQGDKFYAQVEIRVLTRNVTSSTRGMREKTFRVRGTPGTSGWANLTLELDLDEGAHVTAVGVRDEATRESSFISTTLQVGAGG